MRRNIFFFILLIGLMIGTSFFFFQETKETDKGGGAVFIHQSANIPVPTILPSSTSTSEPIYVALLPHHLVAETYISETFSFLQNSFKIQDQTIDRVVIVSPNHGDVGSTAIMSDADWSTPQGAIFADDTHIEQIVSSRLAQIDRAYLEGEHGIYTLLPYVKAYFPGAQITPIALRESMDETLLSKLAETMAKANTSSTLVLVSADFSHYLPKQVADFHDRTALAVLSNWDKTNIKTLDTDARPGLILAMKYTDLLTNNRSVFHLLNQGNSANIVGGENSFGTTSYLTGYFTAGEKTEYQQATLLFVGDLLFDRDIRSTIEQYGSAEFLFTHLDRFFLGTDIVIGNLEGTIGTNKPRLAGELQFLFPPSILPSLASRFHILSLANNHTDDWDRHTFTQTQEYLKSHDVIPLGTPYLDRSDTISIHAIHGLTIGIIGYSAFSPNQRALVIEEIQKLKKVVDYVIVFSHWGVEYETNNIAPNQQSDAHRFIDVGADAIVGTHPHVIQPLEIYKDKPVFYSLGNFIFDQVYPEETRTGLALGVTIEKRSNSIRPVFTLIPTNSNTHWQPTLLIGSERQHVWNKLAESAITNDNAIKDMIRTTGEIAL